MGATAHDTRNFALRKRRLSEDATHLATPFVCLWQTRLQHALRVVHLNDPAFLIGVIRKKNEAFCFIFFAWYTRRDSNLFAAYVSLFTAQKNTASDEPTPMSAMM